MTEREWLTTADAGAMWRFLSQPMPGEEGRRPDEPSAAKCLDALRELARRRPAGPDPRWGLNLDRPAAALPASARPAAALSNLCEGGYGMAESELLRSGVVAAVLRAVVGNPWRKVMTVGVSWRTPTVVEIARDIHDREAWELMPALADALEDAGCDAGPLLMHLRGYRAAPWCDECEAEGYVWDPGHAGPAGVVRITCPRCVGEPKGTRWEPDPEPVRCRGDWALDLILGRA